MKPKNSMYSVWRRERKGLEKEYARLARTAQAAVHRAKKKWNVTRFQLDLSNLIADMSRINARRRRIDLAYRTKKGRKK